MTHSHMGVVLGVDHMVDWSIFRTEIFEATHPGILLFGFNTDLNHGWL